MFESTYQEYRGVLPQTHLNAKLVAQLFYHIIDILGIISYLHTRFLRCLVSDCLKVFCQVSRNTSIWSVETADLLSARKTVTTVRHFGS